MPTSKDHPSALDNPIPVSDATIEHRIYLIRGQRVMLDRDLAVLYGVPTGRLNEQVRRNPARFPEDFMFQLSADELAQWKSHFAGTNPSITMGLRRRPLAFTEQGVAMLSGVLHSARAIAVNVAIMRAFVRLRQLLATHTELAHRVDELEQRSTYHEGQLTVLFDVVHGLMAGAASIEEEPPPTSQIGFHVPST